MINKLKIGRILISFFLLSFIFINPIQARSGCCSGHGGVDCSAGAQSNGNVICNDGWRGSSCSYSEMVMCGGDVIEEVQPTVVPTRLIPTNTPKPIIPTSTPIPTIKPTSTSTPTPTPTETIALPTNTPIPTSVNNQPQVLGATTNSTQSTSSDNPLGNFAIFAWVIYGGYKLIKKLRNKKQSI